MVVYKLVFTAESCLRSWKVSGITLSTDLVCVIELLTEFVVLRNAVSLEAELVLAGLAKVGLCGTVVAVR